MSLASLSSSSKLCDVHLFHINALSLFFELSAGIWHEDVLEIGAWRDTIS